MYSEICCTLQKPLTLEIEHMCSRTRGVDEATSMLGFKNTFLRPVFVVRSVCVCVSCATYGCEHVVARRLLQRLPRTSCDKTTVINCKCLLVLSADSIYPKRRVKYAARIPTARPRPNQNINRCARKPYNSAAQRWKVQR